MMKAQIIQIMNFKEEIKVFIRTQKFKKPAEVGSQILKVTKATRAFKNQ